MTQNIKNKLLAHNFVGKFEHLNFQIFFAITTFKLNFLTNDNGLGYSQLTINNNTVSANQIYRIALEY